MGVQPVAVPPGEAALALLPRLAAALAGGAPVLPYAASAPLPPVPPHDPAGLPEDLVLVVGTSGSTGTPKRALLGAGALRASIAATSDRLGGPGQWLLPLPAHHIAGLQVLLRSLVAGTTPVVPDGRATDPAAAFAAAVARLDPGARRYTSLVPTQLLRLLDDPRSGEALATLDAVLVGGAALPPALRRRAARVGVRVVATYGMSETAGGCVHDGRPLRGVAVRVEDDRVLLGGRTLAAGYLGRADLTEVAFLVDADALEPVERWFVTDDVGHLDPSGRLHVDGRVDDVIVTGGLKVAPRLVEEALTEHVPGVSEAVVVGVPDEQWGQAVAALVVLGPTASSPAAGAGREPTVRDVRAALRGILPDHALPRLVRTAPGLPLRGPGKPDRRAVGALLAVGD
ncbi:MAG TPA: o-succinylbenzoate--CoA ligase [Dermatophilaceae bacterium]|nr:o-succinylbenzoate--CoA ligase [Dermatophilaceae bacterium]